ncbi:hypothetical protein Ahy_A01g000635 isoform C [Arachis hypogaea]|uniref:Transmembrane protein n=1 Tax=Arachis hypogaea TaxID=3818 RepID=A0A445EKQ6_ARAHY|nr:hypothetical protein Ahy_A01g000635 isoform C [Arachis hypogaea]
MFDRQQQLRKKSILHSLIFIFIFIFFSSVQFITTILAVGRIFSSTYSVPLLSFITLLRTSICFWVVLESQLSSAQLRSQPNFSFRRGGSNIAFLWVRLWQVGVVSQGLGHGGILIHKEDIFGRFEIKLQFEDGVGVRELTLSFSETPL